MENTSSQNSPTHYRTLRIWLPILLLPLMVFARFVPDLIQDGPSYTWVASAFGPFLISLVLFGWWLFASLARWTERVVGLLGIIGILALVSAFSDPSMRGPLFIVMTIPMATAAFTFGLVLFSQRLSFQRTLIALLLSFVGAGFSALLKTDGVWGNFAFGLDWRWNNSPEDNFLANRQSQSKDSTLAKVELPVSSFQNPEWPGFRGPNQDGIQHGASISPDWKSNPP